MFETVSFCLSILNTYYVRANQHDDMIKLVKPLPLFAFSQIQFDLIISQIVLSSFTETQVLDFVFFAD